MPLKDMRCWAIIPARGGSKGVPRKNLREVGGIPLITRTVQTACQAQTLERVYITTDDDEIARVGQQAGARTIRRPDALASDTASSEGALLHALDTLEAAGEVLPDILVFLQCTSPFTRSLDIDGAVRLLSETGASCAITGSRSHGFLWSRNPDGHLTGVNHDGANRQRRQDRPVEFLENGAVYALRVSDFRREKRRFCGPVVICEMPAERSLEIDSPADLEIAQRLAQLFDQSPEFPSVVSAVIFDFDGVMTDNKVIVTQDGLEAVRCDRSDGMGLEILKSFGIPLLILSKEENPVVTARARKLAVECQQGVNDKLSGLTAWAEQRGVDLSKAVYVGNDINDIPCLSHVGYPVVTADAHPAVLAHARIVLTRNGGHGAVREVCDRIMAAGKYHRS